jgi:glycogen synthase
MPLVTFYFQLHQPFRLHPSREKFLWDEVNGESFLRLSERCYLPALSMFTEILKKNPSFRMTLGLSGTFLEQAEMYRPEVVGALRELLNAGAGKNQIECLDETYYHSLASLFSDPQKQEFRGQVSLHRDKMRTLFGVVPSSFRNTELIYNNDIADVVADMGYLSILAEGRDEMVTTEGTPVESGRVFRSAGGRLTVLFRDRTLSETVTRRFLAEPVPPEVYASRIAAFGGDVLLLGFDFEHIGARIPADEGIFEFWRRLPEALTHQAAVEVVNPSLVAARFQDRPCPSLEVPKHAATAWADLERNTGGRLGNLTQYELFRDIEKLEEDAHAAGGDLLRHWRHLTTCDHLYYLYERDHEGLTLQGYSNPYEERTEQATHVLTRKVDYLEMVLRRFMTLKRSERTAVLIISPETGRLPEEMGVLARYISGKSGGQGEVVTALCEGLIERGIDVHVATLNLKKRFQRESSIDEEAWREIRYRVDPDRIHLVSSSIFAGLPSAYAGNPVLNAAEFQRELVNNIIKTVRAKSKGQLILHTHDWMAGGVINAYARSRGIPVLHTVHNIFTGHIPVESLFGVELNQLSDFLFFSEDKGKRCIDSQATAIKNASIINFVGKRFLQEVVEGYFVDRHIIPPSVRGEVRAKYYHGTAAAIINAPSLAMYPERCPYLARNYGPDDDVLEAKQVNLVEFQKRTGLNVDPEAILFFWPSRLDPSQKGVELFEHVARRFIDSHSDVQIAVVGDGVGNDRSHEEIMGRIAWSSGGRVCYQRFDEPLSMLGFAAASDVFGASLYEPCGQIDQVGNLFGATATNRDTGGYHDKIRELRMKIDGSPQDVGNGFLFRDYDPDGLWFGLEKSARFHRVPREIREAQIKRIMREVRERYDLRNMIAEYIGLYERLNDGKPLI